MSVVMCQNCKQRPSTGTLIDLCDPCFDEWEAKVKREADASPDGMYKLPDEECAFIADAAFDRSKS